MAAPGASGAPEALRRPSSPEVAVQIDEYRAHDVLALAAAVRSGNVAPREVLDAALAAIEEAEPALGAMTLVDADGARRAVDAGLADGPLRGVPIVIKDLAHHVAGTATTYGSRLWDGAVVDHDSEVVTRYRRAGMVVVGRTRSPEHGLCPTTEPRFGGPTRNPWDPTRTAGGSSGGSGAAVAAGLVPVAHATDGGGSIRIPASCCGLVGFKPTRARIPYGPDLGEGWHGFSTAHVVARTVADSAALLDATHGPAAGDPYAAPPVTRPFLAEVGADPGRLRVALVATRWDGDPVDPECEAAARRTGELLESLGHVVVEAVPPLDLRGLGESFGTVVAANVAASVDERLAALGRAPYELHDDDLEAYTRVTVERGWALSSADLARAVRIAHRVGREVAPFFVEHDVLLTPALATPPWPLGLLDTSDPDGYVATVRTLVPFTMVWNATGQPAVSLPLHRTPDGLPVGVQLVARFGDDAGLLRLSAQLEAAAPWAGSLPAPRPA
jgi:amidase